MITVDNLHFAYPNGTEALSNVSLRCRPGTITGIIGPNGSGKSTLIKCLAGILHPLQGGVSIEGRLIHAMSHHERGRAIAYVQQDGYIPFHFSALEVVLMGRSPHRGTFAFETDDDIARAYRVMEETDTSEFASRCIQELSGGERQRVMLARALVQEARIMLLDEPTSSLDIRHRAMFYAVLARRCRENNLVVVAAMHDLNLASLCCDQLALLSEGCIVSCGAPVDVLSETMMAEVFKTPVSIAKDRYDRGPFVLPLFK